MDNHSSNDNDEARMQRCLHLAQKALGQTAPNPMVGAVVVKAGEVVGEGFHPGAGQPHAEVFALRAAGDRANQSTVYVNLEPCNHYGRTPPCSEALIKAGVARVVVGMVDPDPRVAGSGIARLREAGIEVTVGVKEADCQRLNEAFVHRITHHRPFGILKYAMTLDGKIATTSGHSAWVTSPAARHQVHHLRAACDAVIVGGNTVRKDNPLLSTHGVSHHNPLRVVMSRTLNLSEQAQLWDTTAIPTTIFTEQEGHPEQQRSLQAQGVEVVKIPNLTPDKVMANLYDRGCSSVLWECGGTLAAQAIADGAVQKVLAFIAPKIIGGHQAPGPVGDLALERMDNAIVLNRLSLEQVGPDYLLSGYIHRN
ncbi:MAG: bifunctional diaminohydroxyphosphoribosylaminopyrimidine deaminase/5-amino-6-(5-phosphoribosylamino)uracil reductase RibD [Merismopedia sp. SIO2A8]|nr:bifunctional diaminohydroxyphosphoribosylaminopyrimidine deaminase/5-amino-6-(5-phosphoribosylamino)uracil reductase RibD [Merismopedia sp. SIO2A8]